VSERVGESEGRSPSDDNDALVQFMQEFERTNG